MLTEDTLCTICAAAQRDAALLCVVESPADVVAIESSGSYRGRYFVLMGHLSPLDGIGPEQLGVRELEAILSEGTVRELILATNSTVEGEATAHFLCGARGAARRAREPHRPRRAGRRRARVRRRRHPRPRARGPAVTLARPARRASRKRRRARREPERSPVTSTQEADSPARAPRELLPWLIAVAFFMQALDTTILNTAVPSIARALAVAPLSMKSVLSSYSLALAVFIPVSGWMASRFGTRRVFGGAIALFALGSLLCGLARDLHWLVAFRVLQGCGGAMMVPVGRLTLVRSFPKSELVRAMSFVAIPGLIGPMLGPLAGGLITHYLHWSVVFFVNVPIALLGLYLVYRFLPEYRDAHTPPLDLAGLVLFSSGIALLSYVLEVFGEHRLGATAVAALLALAVLLLLLYARRAARTPHPLLRLALFRVRTFRAAVSGSFFTRVAIGGVPFLIPLLYQVGLGYTPVQSGLLMMPQALAAISLKFLTPRILARHGYRTVLVANTLLLGVLIALFATIGAGTPGLDHRAAGFRLRFRAVVAVHQHEHARVRRRRRRGRRARQHRREYGAAVVDEFRRRDLLAGGGRVRPGARAHGRRDHGARGARGVPAARACDRTLHGGLQGPAPG